MVPGDTPIAAAMFGFCIVARRIRPNFVSRSSASIAAIAAMAVAMITRLKRLAP